MKRGCIIFCFLLSISNAWGQRVCSLRSTDVNTYLCLNGYVNFHDNINASKVVENILEKIDIENKYFVTKVCGGIENAIAIKRGGVNYILLDTDWMESLKYGKSDWFHLSVIGHEIAHHLLGHTSETASSVNLLDSRQKELRADEFSGYVLRLFGASSTDVKYLLTKFPDDVNVSSTHPRKKDREQALQRGYNMPQINAKLELLKELTQDVNFNLKSFPHLISKGRNQFNAFLETGNKDILKNAIKNYQEAIRFEYDPQIGYELGAMFLANEDRGKFDTALELSFETTKDEKYILELISSSIIGSEVKADFAINKYGSLLNSISPDFYDEASSIRGFIDYYLFLARRNYHSSGINPYYLEKAIKLLNNSIRHNEETLPRNQEEFNYRAYLYNSLGTSLLLQDKYESAIDAFTKAKYDFNKGSQYEQNYLENVYSFYTLNQLIINDNIALAQVRLRDWKGALYTISTSETILMNLPPNKSNYIRNMRGENVFDIYYYKARCLQGLKNYEQAIEIYSFLIQKSAPKPYLYYYRGLSNLGLKRMTEACADFDTACQNGLTDACGRQNFTCN